MTKKLIDRMLRAATRLGEWEIYDAVPCKDDLATNTNTPNTKYTKYKIHQIQIHQIQNTPNTNTKTNRNINAAVPT